MARLIKSLKNLGQKINGKEPAGNHLCDVLDSIANDYSGNNVLEVADIKALTTAQIEALKCGDVVIKNENGNKHTYVVSYKEHHVGICLTYTDCENVETVAYDYTDNAWVYNSTDVTHIAQ